MPVINSATASASLNFQLTNYAAGVWNDISGVMRLAYRLAPVTPVPGASGQYKDFSDKNSFRLYNTDRALGGDPKVIQFEAGDAFYNCSPNALECRVDKVEDQQAGAIDGNPNAELTRQLLDQGKVKALMNATALSHVFKVSKFVLDNTVAVAGRGDWASGEVDPIDQINEQLLALSLDVGNTQGISVTMDLGVWAGLRSHPKVRSRIKGVQVAEISLEQFKQLLIIPCDVEIHNIVYDAAQLGQAKDKKRVMAGTLLLHYSVPNPTVYDPSAFKCFTVGPGALVAGVRTYYPPNMLWRGHLLDWSQDIKKTGALCVKRIDVTFPAAA